MYMFESCRNQRFDYNEGGISHNHLYLYLDDTQKRTQSLTCFLYIYYVFLYLIHVTSFKINLILYISFWYIISSILSITEKNKYNTYLKNKLYKENSVVQVLRKVKNHLFNIQHVLFYLKLYQKKNSCTPTLSPSYKMTHKVTTLNK